MKYFDMLAALGEGAAHPGGFDSTLALLERDAIPAGANILEVGCGTGRTACHLAKMGYRVTAVDVHHGMIGKARRRSEAMEVEVDFRIADAASLPFEAGGFDVVFVESVTLFVDIPAALKEYHRVLKDGGLLYDREMVRKQDHPGLKEASQELYGALDIPSLEEWEQLLKQAGFRSLEARLPSDRLASLQEQGVSISFDPYQMFDMEWLDDPAALQLLQRNHQFYEEFGDVLSYAVWIGGKGFSGGSDS